MFLEFKILRLAKILSYSKPHPLRDLLSPNDDFKTSFLLTYLLLNVP